MCGDADSPVEPHSEDYSEPYVWERPAEYALCRTCHGRLHKRFGSRHGWEAFKMHLRRGGYGSDLKEPRVAREILNLAKSLGRERDGPEPSLSPLPTGRQTPSPQAWWEALSSDPESLTASWARPR